MSLLRQHCSPASNSWVRALIFFVLAWACLLFVFVTKLSAQPNIEPDVTSKRFNQALVMLEQMQQRNLELKQMIAELLNNQVDRESAQKLIEKLEYNVEQRAPMYEPTREYEQYRRRIQTNIGEIWNYFSTELGKMRKKANSEAPQLDLGINDVLLLGAEHKRSLISDMENLRRLDGYDAWRQREAKDLSDLVQRRLHFLQNPADCKNAKKLVCELNKACGYGCQLHHVAYCFLVAYATERTMILKSRGWRYHKEGWEEVFKPFSNTCLEADMTHASTWPGRQDTPVLTLPIVDFLVPRPPYLPLAIPEDLATRLKRLHGDPFVWWIGQFLKYLLKPHPVLQSFLNDRLKRIGFKKPVVGVHVRRTDKIGTEADFHGLEEYMTHVEDFFRTQEINGTKVTRRIFIASDDPSVVEEAHKKYPDYEILADTDVARVSAVSTRYTDSSLGGIISDIHLLSLTDYLVCTFSSQVCRSAYEIMQTMHPDAAHRFKSLDDIYYYGGQNAHNRQAVIPHVPRSHNEIQMNAGDLVGVAGNHWNGFSKGRNRRTNQVGLYPSFKVVDKVETVKLPTYPQFCVQFNDTLTSTFEYPSEDSLIIQDSFDDDYYANTNDLASAYKNLILNHIDFATSSPAHQYHHVAVDEIIPLNINEQIAYLYLKSKSSAPFGYYAPIKARIDSLFQLGVTRAPTSNGSTSTPNNGSNGNGFIAAGTSIVGIRDGLNDGDAENEDEPKSLHYIKPANDDLTIAYSETKKTDLHY